MIIRIRTADAGDSGDISQVIIAALRETNSRHYPAHVIAQVERSFHPSALARLMIERIVFVAVAEDRLVGTASLDGLVVRTVFVLPDFQGLGIGRLLMARIDRHARDNAIEVLTVPSSVTAEPFYAKLGFKAVRDSYYNDERTIIMQRDLGGP